MIYHRIRAFRCLVITTV